MEAMAVSGGKERGCSGWFGTVSLCPCVWGPLRSLNWFTGWGEGIVAWDCKVCCMNKSGGDEWRSPQALQKISLLGSFALTVELFLTLLSNFEREAAAKA